MITIDGLTKQQVKLLDIMWELNCASAYENWKSGLSESTMNTVDTLEQLVYLATIDAETENLQEFNEARGIINKFAL